MGAPAAHYPVQMVPAPLVIERVAEHLGIEVLDLRGPGISQSLVIARNVAALLLNDHTLLSQAEIGRALGRTRTNKAAGFQLLSAALKRKGDDQGFAKLLEQVRERVLQGGHHV